MLKTPVEMYYEDYYTCPIKPSWNMGISVPVGLADNGFACWNANNCTRLEEDMLIKGRFSIRKAVNFEYL